MRFVALLALAAACTAAAVYVMAEPAPSSAEGAVAEVAEPTPEPTATPAPLPDHYSTELEGAATSANRRTAVVDLLPVNGRDQRVEIIYDLDAVTHRTTFEGLRDDPEWSVGVRLLLGEMGAWRLRDSRYALLEAVGILETVYNRLEPDLSNPLRIEGVRHWPGCGAGGNFNTCIDPDEYLGLNSSRALAPKVGASWLLAVDKAVAAWFLFEEAMFGEITAGATSFVHRCGGRLYGRPTTVCEGPGADAARGPILFRGPSRWLPDKGRYALAPLGVVDFEEGPPPTGPRAYVDYLLSTNTTDYAEF